MFIAVLFIIAQKQRQLKWPLTDELIKKKKSGITHIVAYYSATKRNKILILATTWMDLKNFMLKQKTVTKNDILYDFMYMKFPEEANLQRQKID